VSSREKLADDLARARTRTLRLVDFDDAELRRQYDPLMSPLVWDLAHIGQQEEFWLLRGGDPDRPGMLPPAVEGLYDAFEHSRASRAELPLLSPERARSYCQTVRSAALDALDALPDDPAGDRAAFVYSMVVSHENQHDETILQALNLRTGAPLLPDTAAAHSCWAWTQQSNRTRWTTNVQPTSSTSRRSGSAEFRLPTANGNSSSTTAATQSRDGGLAAVGSTARRLA
jgi:hypothetical protein